MNLFSQMKGGGSTLGTFETDFDKPTFVIINLISYCISVCTFSVLSHQKLAIETYCPYLS